MKRLKEEKELRGYLSGEISVSLWIPESGRLITALIRACYEDAAKVAEEHSDKWIGEEIAAEIRGRAAKGAGR